jgi:HEAT repeat protein
VTARTALADGSGADLIHNTFEGGAEGWDVRRIDGGAFSAEAAADAERGKVLAVKDGGGARFGRVTVFGRVLEDGFADPNFGGYSVEDYPYLNFMLKSDGKAPLALRVWVNGRPFVIPIIGEPDLSRNNHPWLDRVKFVPDGTWQQVSYNLAASLPGSENRRFVTEITFGDPRTVAQNHYRSERLSTHFIDDFKISSAAAPNAVTNDPDAELEPVGDLNSSDPYLKALGAAKATGTPAEMERIRALLTEEDNLVKANAAAALGRIKDAASVPALVTAARAERVPYPALMMVRALAFQDTPETWAVMKEILRQGRAEEISIAEVGRFMGLRKDPAHIEDLSILITARQWVTRAVGASALGSIGTDPASLMQLTFLLEVDPMVRMAVAQSARPDVSLVARRMEWASVNDLSNTVRGHSFAALTRASDPITRSRGYAGTKEEDPEIRRIIAQSVSLWPMESHVTPLLGLLSDPVPAVRAAAVHSLLTMPYARTFSEMSVLAGENDDSVLYALLAGAKEKKIELPRSMLERLSNHRNPLIRDRVKDLM